MTKNLQKCAKVCKYVEVGVDMLLLKTHILSVSFLNKFVMAAQNHSFSKCLKFLILFYAKSRCADTSPLV